MILLVLPFLRIQIRDALRCDKDDEWATTRLGLVVFSFSLITLLTLMWACSPPDVGVKNVVIWAVLTAAVVVLLATLTRLFDRRCWVTETITAVVCVAATVLGLRAPDFSAPVPNYVVAVAVFGPAAAAFGDFVVARSLIPALRWLSGL